jgi:hypothetical protein
MFEDIVIDQQNLLDSPATWAKVLDLVPDANQKVTLFMACFDFHTAFNVIPQAIIEQQWHKADDGRERFVFWIRCIFFLDYHCFLSVS